ncbi:unnamed protein product [Polarella glacialis]|uniref:Uncharacterized protein n=1 Tax=Polarella glacialis TaxID=89957 RepID=A0A813JQR0_POLGL|nr:unnamed protein product [Polarella glacialis]
MGHCEYSWTKGDVFARFGVNWDDPHYGLTGQVAANIFRLIVNSRTRNLLQTWEKMMMDWWLCSDEASVNKSAQSPFFGGDHRHDQSILGMLLKANVKGVRKCTRFEESETVQEEADGHYSPFRRNLSKGGPHLAVQEEAESGWSLHPEFGIDGLRVRYLFTNTWHNFEGPGKMPTAISQITHLYMASGGFLACLMLATWALDKARKAKKTSSAEHAHPEEAEPKPKERIIKTLRNWLAIDG